MSGIIRSVFWGWAAAACLCGALARPGQAFAQDSPPIDEEKYAKDSSTEINVKNADLAAIIRIFSKKTKRNYILDERVSGKVSIYLPGKVSSTEAIRILDAVLSLKGFTAVPIGENLWKIIPSREARQTTIETVEKIEGRGSPSVVTRLMPLKYIEAQEVSQLITPLISANGMVTAYTGTNSLMLIDSEENIQRLVGIINSIDVPFRDREMTMIPVKHAAAADIAKTINEILGEPGKQNDPNASVPGLEFVRTRVPDGGTPPSIGKAAQSQGGSANVTVSGRTRQPKIIADERTNSLIIVADEDTTARIRALAHELDSPVDLSGVQYYLYRCHYARAEDLSEVLSGLMGGSGSSGSGSRSPSQSTDFGLGGLGGSDSTALGTTSGFSRDRLSKQRRQPGQSFTSQKRPGVSSVQLGDAVSITADPATNSLVIHANKSDYEKVLDLLKKLDIKRRQVLVEAMLLEVGVDQDVKLSTDFLSSTGGEDGGIMAVNNSGQLTQLFSDPTKLSEFSVAAASAGTLHLPNDIELPTQTVLLSALAKNSSVNVLSSPTILATDNEEASIVVGQNVPFLASTASSETNLNNTFNQIDRQDVGITLRISPQISSRDFVTLKIFTEVSSVVAATLLSSLGPTTTIRTSETTAIAKDGQMIVIGGLISDDISTDEKGIPFLKDVPVLGFFFREHTDSQSRKNLLIFITPRIIQDQFDHRDITVAKRDDMESVIEYREVYPAREEVLGSADIDRVTEIHPADGVQQPSTIFNPSGPRQKQPAEGTGVSVSTAGSSDKSPIIVRVSPNLSRRLPESSRSEAVAAAPLLPETAERIPADRGRASAVYIVLQRPAGRGSPGNLPFVLDRQGQAGIIVPDESAASARNFFSAGDSYSYNIQGQRLDFTVSGVFSSADEAATMHPGLKEWYTLSPYEIMNLGNGPWSRR